MSRSILLTLCYVSLLSVSATPVSDDDWIAVCRTLTYYSQAIHINDYDALARAYHPQAHFTYANPETGQIEQFPFGQYISSLYDAPDHPSFEDREIQRLSLDIEGTTAWAKMAITYPKQGYRLYDHLTLVKDQGEWRIISRVSYKERARFTPKSFAETRREQQEPMGIRKTVEEYLVSRKHEDWQRMAQSFHPEAFVAYVDPKREICHKVSLATYVDGLHGETRHYRRRGEILRIDHVGNIAVVKVVTRYRHIKGKTLDYLTLVKSQGQWHIIHKATHKDPMAMLVPA